MCTSDYETWTVYEFWAPRARKEHRCGECHVMIQPGESYMRVNHLFDGKWGTDVRCAGCYFLAELIEETECGGEGQILMGELSTEVDEHVGPYIEERDEYEPGWPGLMFQALVNRQPIEAPKGGERP